MIDNRSFQYRVFHSWRVIDADTLVFYIDQGFNNSTVQTCRLALTKTTALDCPERNTLAGKMVTNIVAFLLGEYQFMVHSWGKDDAYGRFVGEIEFLNTPNPYQLGLWLMAKGLARSMGTSRSRWSDQELTHVVDQAKLIYLEYSIPDNVPLSKVYSSPMKLPV